MPLPLRHHNAIALTILMALSAVGVAQERPKSYPITLSASDVYEITDLKMASNGLELTSKAITIVPIRCEVGITGALLLGSGEFRFSPKGADEIKGTFRGGMLRFRPDDQPAMLPIDPVNAITDHAAAEMSRHLLNNLFRHCWHAGQDALIPDAGTLAADLYSKEHGDLLISTGKEGFTVYNFTERKVVATVAESTKPQDESKVTKAAAPFEMKKVVAEVEQHYSKAAPEIKDYVIWTAKNFGPGELWLHEDAFADLSDDAREKRIGRLVAFFDESAYGRQLCPRLAEASALKDKRLVPGLMKVAGYHVEGQDYDCRAKWMAVAALARQQTDDAVPVLISLVDHGNQNTRNWSRAALSRQTGQDFAQDKQAWARWWQEQGHGAIDEKLLKAYVPPSQNK